MKKTLISILAGLAIYGCNQPAKEEAPKSDTVAKKEAYTYPFSAKYSINWQPGDEKNAVLVLNSFKKYLDGDVKGSFEAFADSIEFIADKFYFKGTKDSLLAMFTPMRAQAASMSFVPDTWLTAYYPDKNETWVTVWGVQKVTDKKGKTDSVYLTDDILIKDGKIAQIDEKKRDYPAPKPKK